MPRVLRLVAALVSLSMCAVTVGGVAHRAVVEHVACEHGQLVELTREASSSATASPFGRKEGQALHAPADALVAATAEHEHHHCALASFRCEASVSHGGPLAVRALAGAVRPVVGLDQAAPPLALSYAPKTSPPV